MQLDLAATLGQLVSIPSVNPMGRAVSGGVFGEKRLGDFLEGLFKRLGLACRREEIHPGRDNVVARLDGETAPEDGGELLLFEVHQDTVPVEGMKIEPFEPAVREGRLYGRGACDVKGGMTSMLLALARLAQERPPARPTVVMACTVNEEYGFSGAAALAKSFGAPAGLIPRKPDAAIVAEPTGLDVVVAHKGVLRWECHSLGVAGHSAEPERGENAIFRMAPALAALERYQKTVVGGLASHALCGSPTISVGTIRGGVSVNTIPDRCTIEIDRRLCPHEAPDEAHAHAAAYVARNTDPGTRVEFDPPYLRALPLSDELNGRLAEGLSREARRITGKCDKIGVPYGTDAPCFSSLGVPTVVFGPGSIRQAHTDEEWVSLDEVRLAADILHQFSGRELRVDDR
jgi:acetylornithine deacetylase